MMKMQGGSRAASSLTSLLSFLSPPKRTVLGNRHRERPSVFSRGLLNLKSGLQTDLRTSEP